MHCRMTVCRRLDLPADGLPPMSAQAASLCRSRAYSSPCGVRPTGMTRCLLQSPDRMAPPCARWFPSGITVCLPLLATACSTMRAATASPIAGGGERAGNPLPNPRLPCESMYIRSHSPARVLTAAACCWVMTPEAWNSSVLTPMNTRTPQRQPLRARVVSVETSPLPSSERLLTNSALTSRLIAEWML